jgi:hypothetical protein
LEPRGVYWVLQRRTVMKKSTASTNRTSGVAIFAFFFMGRSGDSF